MYHDFNSKWLMILLHGLLSISIAVAQEQELPRSNAQNKKPPYAEPPQLKKVFEDDFSTDTRSDYEIEGNAHWQQGKLMVGDGATVARKFDAGSWVELNLDVQFPQLREDGQMSEFRIWFDLKGATDSCVVLRQKRENGATRSWLVVVDTEGAWDKNFTKRDIQRLELDHPLPGGVWRISYRSGLYMIDQGNSPTHLEAHIDNGTATVEQIAIQSSGLSVSIQRTDLRALPSPSGVLSDLDQTRLNAAREVNKKLMNFLRNGQYQEAVRPAKESLKIAKQIRGNYHPDYSSALNNLAAIYYHLGDHVHSESLFLEANVIDEKVFGKNHPSYATSLNNLAALYQAKGDYVRAETLYLQANAIRERVLGKEHPDYARSLNNLAVVYYLMGNYARAEPLYLEANVIDEKVFGKEHPNYATSLNNLAALYRAKGDYSRAEKSYLQAKAIRERVLGKEHPDYASSLVHLTGVYESMGDYARALALALEAKTIREFAIGKEHPDYATSLSILAGLYQSMGDFASALPLALEAKTIHELALGKEHVSYASSLNNLADLYQSLGDYARAEPLYLEAKAIREKVLGNEHVSYAASLTNLADLYLSMGDYARSEPLYLEAKAIREKVPGKDHPSYADSLNNLAGLYQSMGDYSRAEPLHLEAKAFREKLLGKKHPSYAESLNNLAGLYQLMGDYSRAEPLHLEAKAIYEEVLEKEHPKYPNSLMNLANVYHSMGDFELAESLTLQAKTVYEKVLGKEHPSYAICLNNLAGLYELMGEFGRAEPLLRKALNILHDHVENTAMILSERQQINFANSFRHMLDRYISLPSSQVQQQEYAFDEVVNLQGATLVRQKYYRAVAQDSKVSGLFDRLRGNASIYMHAVRYPPLPPAMNAPDSLHKQYQTRRTNWKKRIEELREEKDQLERELAQKNATFRTAQTAITAEALLQALPKDVALVNYVEFDYSVTNEEIEKKLPNEQHFAAFVLRHNYSTRMTDLGPSKAIVDAISDWRANNETTSKNQTANQRLRDLLWNPIEIHFGECKTILISPDGALGTFPFAALPGKDSGTYLIEKYRLACIPSPRLLVARTENNRPPLQRELLLLGGIDFQGDPGIRRVASDPLPPATRGDGPIETLSDLYFDPVIRETTAAEINRIRNIGVQSLKIDPKKITSLSGLSATEDAFRQHAPKHKWLHIATHGFFADPKYQSFESPLDQADSPLDFLANRRIGNAMLLNRVSPGLLSGLALTGANRKLTVRETQSDSAPLSNDGILTAEEIAFTPLDGVELVVLSACETGLGQEAGGEGLLGLQRAFQVAGARTVVASLWKVEDRATQELMRRFYENLWLNKMSKIDALREAQLWMLRHPKELEAMGVKNVQTRGEPRDLKPTESNPAHPNTSGKTDPYFWAAFQLSGDWR